MLTIDEYNGWKSLPTTEKILNQIRRRRQDIQDAMGRGEYVNRENVDETALKSSWACGFVEGVTELLRVYGEGE